MGLKIGIIGAGGIAHIHYHSYVGAGAEVVAIADVSEQTLAQRQASWNIPRTYTDFNEMLAQEPDIDAVSICLPNAFHEPATVAAAKAGKHVLCEKPISLSLDKAQHMIDVSAQAGIKLQIGHHMRSDSAAEKAKAMIEAGDIGDITYIRLRQAHDWAGASVVKDSFGKLANAGGGTLLDNGCHMMDLARYFCGNVDNVFARIATLKYDVEVEDTAVVNMQFASGALGSLETSWSATGWENGYSIYGTKGALEYNNRYAYSGDTEVSILRHTFRTSPGTTWATTDTAEYRFAGYGAHPRSIRNFVASIENDTDIVCTGQDGLEAVRMVLAAYESAKAHTPIQLSNIQEASLHAAVS
ncbi:MAG: Gfo/Idh/MocA family oxidoreductase [Deinococcota bacterium]